MSTHAITRVGETVNLVVGRIAPGLEVPPSPRADGAGLRDKLGAVRRDVFEQVYRRLALIEAQATTQFKRRTKKDAESDCLRLVADLSATVRKLMEVC